MQASMAGSPHAGRLVPLPQAAETGKVAVEQALARRRSVRAYRPTALTLGQLAQFLWAAQGITDRDEMRAAPSAGALYPLDILVVAGNVDGVAPGVYTYLPAQHALVPGRGGDHRLQLATAANGQEWMVNAPAILVIAGTEERSRWKYGERTTRYVHLEAGAAAENIALQAATLGLGTVLVGAFDDDRVRSLIGLPASATPLCLLPVGVAEP
jgi:SagB-type dehydrogenase family enzyme